MRVAVALSGEMRGCPECLRLLDERIVRPFKEAGAEAVDLFLHTRRDPWWEPARELDFRCLWVEENRHRDPSPIVSRANPREAGERRGTGKGNRRDFLYQSYMQQYWSLQAAGLMVARAEEQDGKVYDWVVRSRPDCHLDAPLPVAVLDPAVVSVPWNDWYASEVDGRRYEGPNDRFAVGTSSRMRTYLNKLPDLASFCGTSEIRGEAFTGWQLEVHGIRWVRHDGIKLLQTDKMYRYSQRPDA